MKKYLLAICMALFGLSAQAQSFDLSEFSHLPRFAEADRMLSADKVPVRVVFVGDSITDSWIDKDPDFFYSNDFINRGISGETSTQMLLRFRQNVIDTGATTVVFLVGTNDLAHNKGEISIEQIAGNIESMCELAVANGIRPVICSLLPAKEYLWRPGLQPDVKIPVLNSILEKYAVSKGFTWVDYFSSMADEENGLKAEYGRINKNGKPDTVHPGLDGYRVMENIVMKALAKETAAVPQRRLKLMSYNVRNCQGMAFEGYNFERVREVINSIGPDVVAIQELDSLTKRSNGAVVLEKLKGSLNLYATYGKAIDFNGGAYGVGMLSKEKPLRVHTVSLPGREESRVLLMVEFGSYVYCCTHLSLTEEDCIASAKVMDKALKKFTKKCDKPVYIAGDWNATPGSAAIAELSKYFDIISDTTAKTYPADKPEMTIDYIARWKGDKAAGKDVVLRSVVPYLPEASDHRPVVVTLK